jgi:hypothetical protein
MLGFKGELEINDVAALQFDHDISLIGDNTFLATLKKPLFFH